MTIISRVGRRRCAGLAGLAVLAGLLIPAAPAAARAADRDVVIPAGEHRSFHGGAINGNLIVEQGASADIHDLEVTGNVVLHHAARLTALNLIVVGAMVGSLQNGSASDPSVVSLLGSDVSGRTDISAPSRQSYASVDIASELDSDVDLDGVTVRIDQSYLHSHLIIERAHDPAPDESVPANLHRRSSVCGTLVGGAVSVKDSTGYVDLGGGRSCRDSQATTRVLGDVRIGDNDAAAIAIAGTYSGDVLCYGNAHHPRGDTVGRFDTTVVGRRIGQCKNLPEA